MRARHIPVHTIGFGREQSAHDVEIEDAVIAPRALADSKLAAKISWRQRGYAGQKLTLNVRDTSGTQPRLLVSRAVTLGKDGDLQTETLMLNIGSAGAKTLEISATPMQGEETTSNNAVTRLVNVSSQPRRILYLDGEPRWSYKFIRQAEEGDRMVQVVGMVRTTGVKLYRQGISGPQELATGFPTKPEDLFTYDGLIIGSVEAGFFTPEQQELIRQRVDRRGGGLLMLGGQFSLGDGLPITRRSSRRFSRPCCRNIRARSIASRIRRTAPRTRQRSSRPMASTALLRASSTIATQTSRSGRSFPI